ncbi:MAG: hypothetical protein WC071_03630 [Victivallaceae bacterium]
MNRFFKFTGVCLAVIFGTSLCNAGAINAKSSAFEIGFGAPVQLCKESTTIYGMRISLGYLESRAVYGLDLGLLNRSEESIGFQACLLSASDDTQIGFAVSGVNVADQFFYGVQSGLFNQAGQKGDDPLYDRGNAAGCQLGWINLSQTVFSGCQLGVVNLSDTYFDGLQLGFINSDKDPDKIVYDVVNNTQTERNGKDSCLQIGFINFNEKGFLPVTIGFNF